MVSATPEMKYTTSAGSSGSQFQDRKLMPWSAKVPLPCAITISEMFMLPETISTITMQKPMASS